VIVADIFTANHAKSAFEQTDGKRGLHSNPVVSAMAMWSQSDRGSAHR
jgi:hypothetical protein